MFVCVSLCVSATLAGHGRIDFGDCFLGETVTKTIPLVCNVPIQFGFEIKVIEPHPDITVSPLKGIIPASGGVDVVVQFRPAALRVCKMEIEVRVGEWSSQLLSSALAGWASSSEGTGCCSRRAVDCMCGVVFSFSGAAVAVRVQARAVRYLWVVCAGHGAG